MDLIKVVTRVQDVSEAISSVMNVDVTIVDKQLNRIAGTGRYKECIGQKVSGTSVFGYALKSGEHFIIEDPQKHEICNNCEVLTHCIEYAEVCCPIKVNTSTLGVIGLVAFDQVQKDEIIKNKANLLIFLNRMAELISSMVLEQENTERIELLAKELETVLNSVDRGIIAVDSAGKILHYNEKAVGLFQLDERYPKDLNIKDLIGSLELGDLLLKCQQAKNREFMYKKNQKRIRGFYDSNPICLDGKNLGTVFVFSDISDVLNIVNNVSIGMIETGFEQIIGSSHNLNKVKAEAEKASRSASTVLILGESGTGKELFARAIHFHSKRSKRPFISINCSAIPEQLLESELFGYEEGAFTGAKRGGKAGKFELANNGTIFLDEIGDMQLHLQTKLLRVLQERVIEKVGGKDWIPIDVRVIAATNKELDKKVLEGEFRQDLYYRLNVIPLSIPPLRERQEDIEILVKYLLDKCNRKLEKNINEVDSGAMAVLKAYQWPGNVRELENTIEYAVNMCGSDSISESDLPSRFKNLHIPGAAEISEAVIPIKKLEQIEIEKAIRCFGSSKQAITKAAQALGISRATLYRKLKEYGY